MPATAVQTAEGNHGLHGCQDKSAVGPTFGPRAASFRVDSKRAEVAMLIFRTAIIGFVAFLIANKWGDLPHADTQALQGTWEIVSVEREGVPDPTVVGYTLKLID